MSTEAERLDRLEEKLDACLVLLQMATTHDAFVYTLSDKSQHWINAMHGASIVASRGEASAIAAHQEYVSAHRPEGSRLADTDPSEKAA